MVEIAAAVESAKKLDEAVGLVARVIGKLKADPEAAALKLSDALDEIAKTYRVVDDAVAIYLGLALVAQRDQLDAHTLLKLQGGALIAEVERGRGHCHRILAIYDKFLDKWFSRVLSSDYPTVKKQFEFLGTVDGDLFAQLVELARMLQTEADEVLNLLLADRGQEAQQKVRDLFMPLKALRVQLGVALTNLFALRNELLEMAPVA
jgi:hypothetical protein